MGCSALFKAHECNKPAFPHLPEVHAVHLCNLTESERETKRRRHRDPLQETEAGESNVERDVNRMS